MATEITADQVVATATELGQPEFTRAQLADRLDVKVQDLKGGFKAARQAGRVEKVRDDDDGKGVFKLTNS